MTGSRAMRTKRPGHPQRDATRQWGGEAPAFIAAGQERMQDPAATAALEHDVMRSGQGLARTRCDVLPGAQPGRRPHGSRCTDRLLHIRLDQFAFSKDPALAFGGAAAHNRGIVEFCDGDDRLLPVGFVPLTTFDGAVECLQQALALGCSAIWVPHIPAEGKSPAHVEMDRFWAILADAGVPVPPAYRRRQVQPLGTAARQRPPRAARTSSGRWREPAREGLPIPAPLGGDVPELLGARRRLRTAPRPALRCDRTRRNLGTGNDAAPRCGQGILRAQRADTLRTAAWIPRTTCGGRSDSPPSPSRTSAR